MADFKPHPGSFLPLLEFSRPRVASVPSAPASPITLLEILARQTGESLLLFDLQEKAAIEPSRYGEALKGLRDGGYIEFGGEAPEQTVHLTTRGAEIVRLARPA